EIGSLRMRRVWRVALVLEARRLRIVEPLIPSPGKVLFAQSSQVEAIPLDEAILCWLSHCLLAIHCMCALPRALRESREQIARKPADLGALRACDPWHEIDDRCDHRSVQGQGERNRTNDRTRQDGKRCTFGKPAGENNQPEPDELKTPIEFP